MIPKVQATKENINKLDFIKIKNFYASKNTIKKMKLLPTELEKIFTNRISDKRLVARVYEELLELDN